MATMQSFKAFILVLFLIILRMNPTLCSCEHNDVRISRKGVLAWVVCYSRRRRKRSFSKKITLHDGDTLTIMQPTPGIRFVYHGRSRGMRDNYWDTLHALPPTIETKDGKFEYEKVSRPNEFGYNIIRAVFEAIEKGKSVVVSKVSGEGTRYRLEKSAFYKTQKEVETFFAALSQDKYKIEGAEDETMPFKGYESVKGIDEWDPKYMMTLKPNVLWDKDRIQTANTGTVRNTVHQALFGEGPYDGHRRHVVWKRGVLSFDFLNGKDNWPYFDDDDAPAKVLEEDYYNYMDDLLYGNEDDYSDYYLYNYWPLVMMRNMYNRLWNEYYD